jgi:hypothetical protein
VAIVVYEYWQDRATGEVWAVKLFDARVIGAVQFAPAYVTQELLPYLAYQTDDIADLDKRRDEFRRIDGRNVA